ncbi:hypothetical protein AGMMS50229_12270 [Campylobacterota bacterium]|nr:hypothetical protein AGMMS50229_12270 [Campylobacterota bacterium]
MNNRLKKYLITDPSCYPRAGFERALAAAYARHHPHYICLRDKANPRYKPLAKRFLCLSKRFRTRTILHDHWRLAKRLGADGVHLSSAHACEIARAKQAGLFVIASCHSEAEAATRVRKGADLITLSPVFATPHKGAAIGVQAIKSLKPTIRAKTVALGGIVGEEERFLLADSGIYAFASIRYFTKDFRAV